MMKTRLVAVIDLEVPSYESAGKIEAEWREHIEGWNATFVGGAKAFNHQVGMFDRRGDKTGPLENVVFRNTVNPTAYKNYVMEKMTNGQGTEEKLFVTSGGGSK